MSANEYTIINEIFDKLHDQKKHTKFRIQLSTHTQYL